MRDTVCGLVDQCRTEARQFWCPRKRFGLADMLRGPTPKGAVRVINDLSEDTLYPVSFVADENPFFGKFEANEHHCNQ